jgi:hypothetical protein
MTIGSKQLDSMIADLAKDLRPIVQQIDSDPLKTTKHNYGRYMNLIASIAKGNKQSAQIVVAALLDAGANRDGVAAAYKIIAG